MILTPDMAKRLEYKPRLWSVLIVPDGQGGMMQLGPTECDMPLAMWSEEHIRKLLRDIFRPDRERDINEEWDW